MSNTAYREHSTPLFLTSSFIYESAEQAEQMFAGAGEGDIYSRFTNPNTTELIQKFCVLEETENGVATSSGMAAIFSTLSTLLNQGDHIVACSSLFGNTLYILNQILPKWGINCTFVAPLDRDGWQQAITSNTKMVLVESPTNPSLEIIDLPWLADLCHQNNAIFCVDNCFATPILQKPVDFDTDLVIHSATKWIDGQGRVLGGLVLGSDELIQPIFDFLRRTGACLSPFNAWLLSKSTETLQVRMHQHCTNALQLAQWLESQEGIKRVRYPFLPSHPQHDLARQLMKMGGGIVTIDIDSDKEGTFRFINALTIPSITANLGDSRTIVTHPSTTTHSKLSPEEQEEGDIFDSTIRISVGLENIEDLQEDIEQALKRSL